jgi:hypothetical protein
VWPGPSNGAFNFAADSGSFLDTTGNILTLSCPAQAGYGTFPVDVAVSTPTGIGYTRRIDLNIQATAPVIIAPPLPAGPVTISLDFQVFSSGTVHHWCDIYTDDGGASDWDFRSNVVVRYWRIGKAVTLSFDRSEPDSTIGPNIPAGGSIGGAPARFTNILLCEGAHDNFPVGPNGIGSVCDAIGCTCTLTGASLFLPGGPWKAPCLPATTNVPIRDPVTSPGLDMITWGGTSIYNTIGSAGYFPSGVVESFFLDMTEIGNPAPPFLGEVRIARSLASFTSPGLAVIFGGTVSYYTV